MSELKSDHEYNILIKNYFEKYSDFFPNVGAKASFLVGVLTGFLLEIQRIQNPDLKIEPFWRSLHGLNIDQRLIKQIFTKAVDKLKIYERSYSSLLGIISSYLQEAGNDFKLDKVEISWFFTHGLASYQKFRREKDNANKNTGSSENNKESNNKKKKNSN